MQLTLAAGFVPFSSVLNTVLVLSVVRGRRLYSCGRTGRRGGSAAAQVGRRAGGPCCRLLGQPLLFGRYFFSQVRVLL